MRYSISNTAEYGDYLTGPDVITATTKEAMKKALTKIQSGEFTREFIEDSKNGSAKLKAWRKAGATHQLEDVGAKLRELMPCIKANKLVSEAVSD